MAASPVLLRDMAQAGKEFSRAKGVLISHTSPSLGGKQPCLDTNGHGFVVCLCVFPQE